MIEISATSPTGSGLTFHQMLAMVQNDVSSLMQMVCENHEASDAAMYLDEVSELLERLEGEVANPLKNGDNSTGKGS